MRAYLNQDIIVGWSTDKTGTEVGIAPLGVGMERLRFDGEKIVDLANLTTLHIETISGCRVFHCLPVPGSQAVAMKYSDRKKLINEAGVYRVKTPPELTADVIDTHSKQLEYAVQQHLNSVSKENGFSDIASARTYAAYDNEFRDEGQAMLVWSASCWAEYNKSMKAVTAGAVPPATRDFVAALPDYSFSKEALTNYRAMILRRADVLEKKGDILEAQLLRLKVN